MPPECFFQRKSAPICQSLSSLPEPTHLCQSDLPGSVRTAGRTAGPPSVPIAPFPPQSFFDADTCRALEKDAKGTEPRTLSRPPPALLKDFPSAVKGCVDPRGCTSDPGILWPWNSIAASFVLWGLREPWGGESCWSPSVPPHCTRLPQPRGVR